MTLSIVTERSLLNDEDFALVSATHHPAIYDFDGKGLQTLRKRLREMRDKARTQYRQRAREVRGKADARGKSFSGTAEQPRKQMQIFSQALKRVNNELARFRRLAARTQHIEAARKALALRRAANFKPAWASDQTPSPGMQPVPNTRRRRTIPGSQVGSVSQATKAAQAIKDDRHEQARA